VLERGCRRRQLGAGASFPVGAARCVRSRQQCAGGIAASCGTLPPSAPHPDAWRAHAADSDATPAPRLPPPRTDSPVLLHLAAPFSQLCCAAHVARSLPPCSRLRFRCAARICAAQCSRLRAPLPPPDLFRVQRAQAPDIFVLVRLTACHTAAAPPPESPLRLIGTPRLMPPSSLLPESAVSPSAANTRSASPVSAVAAPPRPAAPKPLSSTRAGDTGTSPRLLARSSPRLLAMAVPSHLLDRPLPMPVSDPEYAACQD